MPSGRASKRARQKERRNARVQAWTQAYRKRRRQRLFLLGGSLAVIVIGVLIVLFAKNPFAEKKKPAATATAAASKACGTKTGTVGSEKKPQYNKPCAAQLRKGRDYIWKIETSKGTIEIKFDTKNNPTTTNSIAFLTKKHFFDGLFFHRISDSVSVIQGGDPTGTGTAGAGYTVVEKPRSGTKYTRGIVAMAKSGTEPAVASSSQFFIVFGKNAEPLPPDYAVVGEVVDGMSVVDAISKTGKPDETPKVRTFIKRATVVAE